MPPIIAPAIPKTFASLPARACMDGITIEHRDKILLRMMTCQKQVLDWCLWLENVVVIQFVTCRRHAIQSTISPASKMLPAQGASNLPSDQSSCNSSLDVDEHTPLVYLTKSDMISKAREEVFHKSYNIISNLAF